jgi:uncharacterized protein Yka (UPF0111/DUF47 family)
MKNSLLEMLRKTQEVEELKKQVEKVEDLMEQAYKDADHYEKVKDKMSENICANLYNIYNETRLKILLRINKLEKEILEFEYNAVVNA